MKAIYVRLWIAIGLAGGALVAAVPPAGAQATASIPPLVPPGECNLPGSGPSAPAIAPSGLLGGSLLGDGPLPIPSGDEAANLVIHCVALDHNVYQQGSDWSATVVVTNQGTAESGEFQLQRKFCRLSPNGFSTLCSSNLGPLSGPQSPLAAGESRVITSAPTSFFGLGSVPIDPSEDGLPLNELVYLRVNIVGELNFAIAQATYPSGPQDPNGDDPSFVDEDLDGYSPLAGDPDYIDCDDTNPLVYPHAFEILGDGPDNDCTGGDLPRALCDEGEVWWSDEGVCHPDPFAHPLSDADLDGSNNLVDCDDQNAWVYPGAPELMDGIDNNCNGNIDEPSPIPDFTLSVTVWEDTMDAPGSVPNIFLPALYYEAEVQNVGGGNPPLDSIEAVYVEDGSGGPLLAVGSSGSIPLDAFYGTYCYGGNLRFAVADNGIFDEQNFSNNSVLVQMAPTNSGPMTYHDVRFGSPDISASSASSILIYTNAVAEGDCPAFPRGPTTNPAIPTRFRVTVNGDVKADLLTVPTFTGQEITTDENMHPGDRVCLEITLDPAGFFSEPEETPLLTNNVLVGAYEFHNPVFGPPRLDVVDVQYGEPAGTLDCEPWSQTGNGPPIVGSAQGSLIGGSPRMNPAAGAFGALGGAFFLGALGGGAGWAASRRWMGAASPAAIAGGALVGVALGAAGGLGAVGAIQSAQSMARVSPPPTVEASGDFPVADSFPACEDALVIDRLFPADGMRFKPGEFLVMEYGGEIQSEAKPSAYEVRVTSPSGRTMLADWSVSDDGTLPPLDLVHAAALQRIPFFNESGEYQWSVALGQGEDGRSLCSGSAARAFTIEHSEVAAAGPTATPSVTPTPTQAILAPGPVVTLPPTVPPTKGVPPTATSVPADTQGPAIKNISDSPDPIIAGSPKGCTPTTSTVSASISDPSGVSSATVQFSKGGGSYAMGGSGTWSASVGPFNNTGAYNYSIVAVDGLGNSSSAGGGQITVAACIP